MTKKLQVQKFKHTRHQLYEELRTQSVKLVKRASKFLKFTGLRSRMKMKTLKTSKIQKTTRLKTQLQDQLEKKPTLLNKRV